ncbi:ubiquitin-protein ligase [Lithospermum erythrorhizon]|uniref:Ubiquitin-protein ligase n=1 Tax=Lithospermum erythrorhizon TaxID=34254 RepID=A0AAV3PJ11_LITER
MMASKALLYQVLGEDIQALNLGFLLLESRTHYADPSLSYVENSTKNANFSHDFSNDRSSSFDKYGKPNGFSFVSRSQVSARPGFSPSNRAPPPGFTSQERVEHSFDPFSRNNLLDTSLSYQYQASMAGNLVSSGDIEFMDPAILAVGKGMLPVGLNNSGLDTRHNFSSQYSTYENEARLQLLMERSLHLQQNHRYSDMGNNFTHLQDAFGIPPQVMEQTLTKNLSPFPQLNSPNFRNSMNGHWEGWNEVHSDNQFAMAEVLRNERMGLNNYYAGQEESLFRMPSSGDVYNRPFGI